MIAGLPWTSWLLILAAAGVGLVLVLVFYFAHRENDATETNP